MVYCIKCDSKIGKNNIVISDECEGILERRYQCENCGIKFKRVFEMFLEEEVKKNRKNRGGAK